MSISYTYVGVRHFIDPDFFLDPLLSFLRLEGFSSNSEGLPKISSFPLKAMDV